MLGITVGPDGSIWFTENGHIGRLDIATGSIVEYNLPSGDDQPYGGITTGPDGAIWYTGDSRISRLDPVTGTVTDYSVPTANAGILRITTGPDGNLWFTEVDGNAIGTLDPATGAVTEFALEQSYGMPIGITTGADGALWFAAMDQGDSGGYIGHITTDGTVTTFVTPTSWSLPQDVTLGADGNVWFTEIGVGQLGRISPTGVIEEFAVPSGSGSGPYGIAASPGGTIWFTENSVKRVGVLWVGDAAFAPFTTAVSIRSSDEGAMFGESVTFTATVRPAGVVEGTPTGTVTFTVDGVAQTPVALVDGTATFEASGLGVGPHTVTASCSGSSSFAAGTSATFAQQVARADTVTGPGRVEQSRDGGPAGDLHGHGQHAGTGQRRRDGDGQLLRGQHLPGHRHPEQRRGDVHQQLLAGDVHDQCRLRGQQQLQRQRAGDRGTGRLRPGHAGRPGIGSH
ncbi:MAG: Ig-like domain repeat protein [Gemmataceae bacterium]|nr:Ig-like domain repeat protein [Gemmataceae bacterium]